MKYIISLLAVAVSLVFGLTAAFFYLKSSEIKQKFEGCSILQEKSFKDTESFKADNLRLADELKKINISLRESQQDRDKLIIEAQTARQSIESLRQESTAKDKTIREFMAQNEALMVETGKKDARLKILDEKLVDQKVLEEKADTLEKTLSKERALYHYNLGVAYTRAEDYDDAREEFNKALKDDPSNGEAHYNLAYIDENIKNSPEQAALHYQKYLGLRPQAKDSKDVKAKLQKLLTKSVDFPLPDMNDNEPLKKIKGAK
jgi:tetratricopeptide (TPR) repeat protein